MANGPSERELFDVTGPFHLLHVDWTEPNHKSSIAASLIRGVYILEQDRQQKRVDQSALAPRWWEFFGFELKETFKDNAGDADSSIFGAIFMYQPHTLNEDGDIQSQSRPPKYVIAFRGVIMEPDTRCQDLLISTKLLLNELTQDPRYQTSLERVQEKIEQVGAENVWLAGHSLGAAIALQIGKTMAKQGLPIDSYLYNPPDLSYFSGTITKPVVGMTVMLSCIFFPVVILGFSLLLLKNTILNIHQSGSFMKLCEWKPSLFVNQNDPICRGYIEYFKLRKTMKKLGLCGILITGGGRCDQPHFIPTAQLVKNVNPEIVRFKLAHGIRQWWDPVLNLESVAYEFAISV
ncbi:GDSL esterase/lipase At4g10955-like [Silene latifolia]|uniref:GDSL esterase/lipase At4g10955-like n=1 Tax=Silene latifolia TaxID=37657 RepID=UPI003D7726E6